jgi:hypothetical protein
LQSQVKKYRKHLLSTGTWYHQADNLLKITHRLYLAYEKSIIIEEKERINWLMGEREFPLGNSSTIKWEFNPAGRNVDLLQSQQTQIYCMHQRTLLTS